MPYYQNDMMHCNQEQCAKKGQCYRYWLGKEIKNSGFQYASFYYPEKPVTEGCSYFIDKKLFLITMATIKAYTDLNQSCRLAEILPIESADMYYTLIDQGLYLEVKQGIEPSKDDVPCWSLAALLSIIPKRIKDYNVFRIDIGDNDFSAWYDEICFGVNSDLPDIIMEEPIDACYEMILKLHKLNLL